MRVDAKSDATLAARCLHTVRDLGILANIRVDGSYLQMCNVSLGRPNRDTLADFRILKSIR